MNDFCFLLIDFPARYEKLSRYDLFLLVVNMLAVIDLAMSNCDEQLDGQPRVMKSQIARWKVEEEGCTYTWLKRDRSGSKCEGERAG